MSFLSTYAQKYNLPDLRPAVTNKLNELESKLDQLSGGVDQFQKVIAEYTPQIFSLVERIKANFHDWKFSFGNTVSSFRFVVGIAGEVAQIVHAIGDKVVPPGVDVTTARKAKIEFGKELTYYIYCLWDPRLVKQIPVGIESWVEKKVIYWIAGIALDSSFDFFEKHQLFGKDIKNFI